MPKGKLLTSASFSPDGRFVLASGKDGAVRLYRCEICGNRGHSSRWRGRASESYGTK